MGSLSIVDSRRSLFGSPVPVLLEEVDEVDHPPGLTFQVLDQMKAHGIELENRRVKAVDRLWHAVVGERNGFVGYDEYARLYPSVAKFCTGSSTTANMDDDWAMDVPSDNALDHMHFHQLVKQTRLSLSKCGGPFYTYPRTSCWIAWCTNSSIQVSHRLVSYALRDCNRVNPHAIATAVHDLLGCMLPSGSWESSNAIVVRVLQLDGSTSTRYGATQAAVAYLDRVVAADSRWWTNAALRGRTMTWLARHEEDTHFADLQALLLRLHISFDGVAPLMRLRLDPLVHSVRSLVLDAVVTMDLASLLPCLEWLRELTPPRWRVLASPIGVHPTMTTQAQVQVYLAKLSHFTLVPELCEFCNNHSVVDKQDLLVFIHTLSPLELGHFRETLQRPTHKFATAPGVKVAVAFYTSLSAMQRLEMKSQLHAILRETKANPPVLPNKGTPVPSLNNNVLHSTRSRPRRRQKSKEGHHRRPLAPLLRPTMSAPSISLDSSSLAPMVVMYVSYIHCSP
ncbi:hypothetical protein AaE_013782 [Aphanomyces astaci]|uniref:Uncharacterized protein n=1 Tax=Aphanomyces astaci TaxID=112090 RepID=A0A6A4Z8P7_APHAT|nr:hypothetical protein AaE_013782 [Aphanomyces astaci]